MTVCVRIYFRMASISVHSAHIRPSPRDHAHAGAVITFVFREGYAPWQVEARLGKANLTMIEVPRDKIIDPRFLTSTRF